jgi:hypothetical protein
MRKKTLQVGDERKHTLPHLNNKVRRGKVSQILDSQFVYEDNKGSLGFCLLRNGVGEDYWEYADAKTKGKK